MMLVYCWYCLLRFCEAEIVINNDNDNDKRLGLTAKADQPDHKKYSTQKIKIDNEHELSQNDE